jgi:aminopeptidase N
MPRSRHDPAGETIGSPTSGDPYFPSHGNGGYRVDDYSLTLTYDPTSKLLVGTARLGIVAGQRLSSLTLDLHRLKVSRVTVDSVNAFYRQRRGKLHIVFPFLLSPGQASHLGIDYGGFPQPIHSTWGDLGWDTFPGWVVVASQPLGAPSWLPCNDHPSDKASYRIELTVPEGYEVLASGVLEEVSTKGGRVTRIFAHPEPVSTYLPTILIGDFVIVEQRESGVPIRNAFPAGTREACAYDFGRQGQMMEVFQRLFGQYPFSVYGAAVVPTDLDEPVETQTLALFGRNHVTGTRLREDLVAHELAHHWFGNCVTADTWRSIWLHEGFAKYAEWLWSENSGGADAASLARDCWTRLARSKKNILLAEPRAKRIFDPRVYERGAITLHALRISLGESQFFELLRDWVDRHRYGTAGTEALIALASQHAGRDLSGFLRPWLFDTALPLLPAVRR